MSNLESSTLRTNGELGSLGVDSPLAGTRSFGDYYLGIILRPRRGFDALVTDSRRLKFGMLALGVSASLYTLVYVFLTLGGAAPSAFRPWLAIPSEVYYRYNQFLLVPSMVLCWILSAGVAQLLSRLFSGTGSFEDTLSVLGFGIGIAPLASLLHDLTDSFLGAMGFIDLREYEVVLNSPTIWRTLLWICYGAYFVWFPLLFSTGIGSAQRMRRGPAIFVGMTTFIVYQVVFLIFNR